MNIHLAKYTQSDNKKKRWWLTHCSRKFLSKDKFSKPEFVTGNLDKVTCRLCQEEGGLEFLSYYY